MRKPTTGLVAATLLLGAATARADEPDPWSGVPAFEAHHAVENVIETQAVWDALGAINLGYVFSASHHVAVGAYGEGSVSRVKARADGGGVRVLWFPRETLRGFFVEPEGRFLRFHYEDATKGVDDGTSTAGALLVGWAWAPRPLALRLGAGGGYSQSRYSSKTTSTPSNRAQKSGAILELEASVGVTF